MALYARLVFRILGVSPTTGERATLTPSPGSEGTVIDRVEAWARAGTSCGSTATSGTSNYFFIGIPARCGDCEVLLPNICTPFQ